MEIQIYKTDALILFERLKNDSFDIIYFMPRWCVSNNISDNDFDDFLYKSFQQLKRILSSKGVVFVESSENDTIRIRNMMQNVFSNKNFVGEFVVPRGYRIHSNSVHKFKNYELLVCYQKSSDFELLPIKVDDNEINKLFSSQDDKGRYRKMTLTFTIDHNLNKFNWKSYKLNEGQAWRYNKAKLEELDLKGLIEHSEKRPYLKRYLKEEDKYIPVSNLWNDIPKYTYKNKYKVNPTFERILEISYKNGYRVLGLPILGNGLVEACLNKNIGLTGLVLFEETIDEIETKFENILKVIDGSELNKMKIEFDKYEALYESEEEFISKLILKGENNEVEFKESCSFNHKLNKVDKSAFESILKCVASFCNSEKGGILLIM